MGFRFRRSVRIVPGLRLNFGKGGLTSLSVGRRGITANIDAKGIKTTFSVPGTGLSYSTKRTGQDTKNGKTPTVGGGGTIVALLVVAVAVLVAALR